MNGAQFILANIDSGISEYQMSVHQMSDHELWSHCFEDDDVQEGDYCLEVWRGRVTHCLCTPDVTTGWTETDGQCLCNVCGKVQLGEELSKK